MSLKGVLGARMNTSQIMSGCCWLPLMKTVTRREGPGINRVTPSGELDIATVPQLNDALSQAASGSATVILDLSQVTFMDSTGLHAILCAHARLGETNSRLVVIPGCRQVQRIFEITGADRHVQFTNAPDAVRSAQARPRLHTPGLTAC